MDCSTYVYRYRNKHDEVDFAITDKDVFIEHLCGLRESDRARVVLSYFEKMHVDTDAPLDLAYMARDVAVYGGDLFDYWASELLYGMEDLALEIPSETISFGCISVECIHKEVEE